MLSSGYVIMGWTAITITNTQQLWLPWQARMRAHTQGTQRGGGIGGFYKKAG